MLKIRVPSWLQALGTTKAKARVKARARTRRTFRALTSTNPGTAKTKEKAKESKKVKAKEKAKAIPIKEKEKAKVASHTAGMMAATMLASPAVRRCSWVTVAAAGNGDTRKLTAHLHDHTSMVCRNSIQPRVTLRVLQVLNLRRTHRQG